ncbi:hypothetical protein BGZ63DRAFT_373230 [Mariannaea sp. PMI_226]|nr:hypothetical protein BGZ63DRAFT_373230 [Mariannaea sp. PMI_226]
MAKDLINAEAYPHVANGFQLACLRVAMEGVFRNAGHESRLGDTPLGVMDFLAVTACLFSPKLQKHLRSNFDRFDNLCGEESVSDMFLAERTIQAWAYDILDFYLGYFFRLAMKKEHDCQSNGTPTPPALVPIQQIQLQGTFLKDAWETNKDIQTICDFGGSKNIPMHSWKPSTPGAAPVFRGVSHHLKQDGAQIVECQISTTPPDFSRKPGAPHLDSCDSEHPSIYTSFSAPRAFLWAVFMAELFQDPPAQTQVQGLTQEFRLRGTTYQGILLFKFDSVQPAPSGLSWYQLPEGRELEWANIGRRQSIQPHPERHQAAHNLQQETTDSPDLIHGRDLYDLRKYLTSWSCEQALLWQTAFTSRAAVESLSSRLVGIYAISFEQLQQHPENISHRKGKIAMLKQNMGIPLRKRVPKRNSDDEMSQFLLGH